MQTTSDDDDVPQLSAETFAALQEFYQSQAEKEISHNSVQENWQLSQFWYDEQTIDTLVNIACKSVTNSGKVALVSCPSLYPKLKENIANNEIRVLEYDKRFEKFGDDFIFYDYHFPLNLPESFKQQFDLVIADPPFLSDECLTKTAETIKYLSKDKILLCTGSIMSSLAQQLLNVSKTSFEPKHANNLANEFSCYSNFDIDSRIH